MDNLRKRRLQKSKINLHFINIFKMNPQNRNQLQRSEAPNMAARGQYGIQNFSVRTAAPRLMEHDKIRTPNAMNFGGNEPMAHDKIEGSFQNFNGVINFTGSVNGTASTGIVKQVGYSYNRGPLFILETTTGQKFWLLSLNTAHPGTAMVVGGNFSKATWIANNGLTDGRVYAFPISALDWSSINTWGYPGNGFMTNFTSGTPIDVCALSELGGFDDLNSLAANVANTQYGYYYLGSAVTPTKVWTVQTNGNVALGNVSPNPVALTTLVPLVPQATNPTANGEGITNEDLAALLAAQGGDNTTNDGKSKDNTAWWVAGGIVAAIVLGVVVYLIAKPD